MLREIILLLKAVTNTELCEFKEYMLSHGLTVTDSFKLQDMGMEKSVLSKKYDQSQCIILADEQGLEYIENSSELIKCVPFIGVGNDFTYKCKYQAQELKGVNIAFARMVYARFYHEPLVIAKTSRLIIREMTLKDLDQLYLVYDTLKECPYVEPLYVREEEETFSADYIHHMYGFYGYGLWLLIDKESGNVIGRAGIENREIDGKQVQELGYLIGTPWQGRHFALEACEAIMGYAFSQLELEQLYLCCDEKNKPSIAFAQKLGFSLYASAVDGMNIYRTINDQ